MVTRSVFACLSFACAVVSSAAIAKPDIRDLFFTNGTIPHIRINLNEAAVQSLRQDSHRYAKATISESGKTYPDVGIHLKGNATFQHLDGKPSLTLNFDKFVRDQTFHGLDKLHLNNSLQDPTYMCEYFGSYLFRIAGVPAARVSHARVELNGRDLGLYVLVEGYDRSFLKRHFKNPDGNFYDANDFQDITDPLEITAGRGSQDRSDLKILAEAAQERDHSKRMERLAPILDLDRFYSYLAIEIMASSFDGYALNKNNYRLYCDPESKRFTFIPTGIDQLFVHPQSPLSPDCAGLVAGMLLSAPEGRQHYRNRCGLLFTNALSVTRLTNMISMLEQRLRPALAQVSAAATQQHATAVAQLQKRLVNRLNHVAEELAPAQVLSFEDDGAARLTGWRPHLGLGNAELTVNSNEAPALTIYCAGGHQPTIASWRTRVVLPKGRYRVEAKVKADGLIPLRNAPGGGVLLRVYGRAFSPAVSVLVNGEWQPLHCEFSVDQDTIDDVICEVRAHKGLLIVEVNSLKLRRL